MPLSIARLLAFSVEKGGCLVCRHLVQGIEQFLLSRLSLCAINLRGSSRLGLRLQRVHLAVAKDFKTDVMARSVE